MINSQAHKSDSIDPAFGKDITMNYEFENDHAQYMSLGDVTIPFSLELRAKAALAELADIQRQYDMIVARHEAEVRAHDSAFEEAFNHYEGTKEDWIRCVDEHGNIQWIHASSIVDMHIPEWMNDVDVEKTDVLSWGDV